MGFFFSCVLVAALVAGGLAAPAGAKEGGMARTTRERSQVDDAYKWKVEDLYPDVEAWEKDLKKLEADIAVFSRCEGQLGKSAAGLAGCLQNRFEIEKRYMRLGGYARRVHDQDAADVTGQELHERIGKKGTQMDTAFAFFDPEILAIEPKKLAGMLRAGELADYGHYIDNIIRRRDHVLSRAGEEIVARAGDLAAVPHKVFQTFSTLNLPFPEVTLRDGVRIRLTQAMYTRFRAASDREDRIRVFQAFWGTYERFRETYAGLLAGVVNRDYYYARVRGYESDLAAALDGTNVPSAIYTNMIEQVRSGLPLLWRYLKLRKKLLGVDELGYHDLYSSIVPSVRMEYDWDSAKGVLMAALAPLGEEYLAIIRRCFEERWADVYPTKGKRSGAYMSGSAYDVHPYVLLNYNDDYESLSTAAHEFGHAGHSCLSNEHQKFHYSRYPIFTAEVASTANENLLRLYVVERETDEKKKLYLLGQYLESWRQTVFRQSLFAEFEIRIHEMARQGTPLTADLLSRTYLRLLREYYGEAEGVCRIDPLYAVEWAYIPHLYYNFYMFQYTTSFIASTAIARKIHAGDDKARDDYLAMLAAGGSRYPVDLLEMAGVDMTGPEPYQAAFKALERALDEAERLVK